MKKPQNTHRTSPARLAILFFATALMVFTTYISSATAAPTLMPVQGVIADADEVPLSGDIEVAFALYADASGSALVWSETKTVSFEDGYFTTYLGDEMSLTPDVFRDSQEVWLGIAVDGDDEMNLIELATAPYAAYAEYAGTSGDAELLGGQLPEYYAAADHETAWSSIIDVPAGLEDGDDDTTYAAAANGGVTITGSSIGLDESCGNDQILQKGTNGWACAELDFDTFEATIAGMEINGTTLTITEGTTFHSLDLHSLVDDADANPNNELLTNTSFDGSTLTLTEAGTDHTVDLTSVRTTGACSPGATISEIKADGTITCTAGPEQIVWVAPTGGDYTTLEAAISAINDASDVKPYVIRLVPGVYVVSSRIDMKAHVSIVGESQASTVIRCDNGSSSCIRGNDGAHLQDLTIEHLVAGVNFNFVYSTQRKPGTIHFTNVTIRSEGSPSTTGLYISGVNTIVADNLTVDIRGGGVSGLGVYARYNSADITLRNSRLYVEGIAASLVSDISDPLTHNLTLINTEILAGAEIEHASSGTMTTRCINVFKSDFTPVASGTNTQAGGSLNGACDPR